MSGTIVSRSPTTPPARRDRRRRHGAPGEDDRLALESDGWRTTLDYRENHVRTVEGVLEGVETHWRGEAERLGVDGRLRVLAVIGPSPARVWRRLRLEAEVLLDLRPQLDPHVEPARR
jgi:hypothetical protein